MKKLLISATVFLFFISCNETDNAASSKKAKPSKQNQLEGTWKLISQTLIEDGDTTETDYMKDISFIKILNETHFAFLQHDLSKGIGSNENFSAGGGRYTLVDNNYTENLEYCSDKQWEGNSFSFTISLVADTLIQAGVEKIDSLQIDRLNIEKYVRLKE